MRLRAIVTYSIKESKKSAAPSSLEATNESSDDVACTANEDVVALREHNAQLSEANGSLQVRNKPLLAKVDALTENNHKLNDKVYNLTGKMEKLLLQLNKTTTDNNSARDPKSDDNQHRTTDPEPATPAQLDKYDDSPAPTIPSDPASATPAILNTPRQPTKLSLANVAQKGLSSLPSRLQARMRSSMQSLGAAGFKARRPTVGQNPNVPKPDPVL